MAAFVISSSAAAADKAETGDAFVGATLAGGDSEYAGVSYNLSRGASFGWGVAVSLDGGHYHYDSGGTTIHAAYEGAGGQITFHGSGDWGWASVAVGPGYTHTTNHPPDPASRLNENAWSFVTSSNGGLERGPWQMDWWASYGTTNGQYGGRLAVTHAIQSSLRMGVEADLSGNRQYRSEGAGPTLIWTLPRIGSLELGGGPYKEASRTGGFLSVGYSRGF